MSLIVFLIGACLGSFFKLVVDRYGTGDSIVFKPSYCPSCKKTLPWWQNIPIISFLILRGKCFNCKSKIDIYCFYSELITGTIALLVFISAYNKKINLSETLILIGFVMILTLLSMFDLKHRIIPHTVTYSAIIFVIIFQFVFNKNSLALLFANLGIAFLAMDFICIFSTLIKRFNLEANIISIPLVIWSICFLFSQNIFLALVSVIIYFFISKIKIPNKMLSLIWFILFLLVLIEVYKITLLDFDPNKLILYFSGIGIIYFVLEILVYFLSLFFNSNNDKDKSCKVEDKVGKKVTIGGGDITVFALISVFLGYKGGFLTLFIASLLALISHFILRGTKNFQAQSSEYIPFVPFLSLACFIIIMTINGT